MDFITAAIARKYTDTRFEELGFDNLTYHFCLSGEYNSSTGVPTVESPDENTMYFTPGDENVFNVYIYNNGWELFTSVELDLSTIPTDDTLAVAGTAADAKAVGDELYDVKSDLNQKADQTDLDAISSEISCIENLEASEEHITPVFEFSIKNTAIKSQTISCKAGDTISYVRTQAANGKLYGTAALHIVINGSETYQNMVTPRTITLESDCDVYITAAKTSTSDVTLEELCVLASPCFGGDVTVVNETALVSTIQDIQEQLDGVDDKIEDAIAPFKGEDVIITPDWTPNSYYNSTLTLTTYSSFTAAKIDVSAYIGGTLQLCCYAMSSARCGFTDENDAIITTWTENALTTKEIPNNAKWLYISNQTGRVTFSCVISPIKQAAEVAYMKGAVGLEEYDSTKAYLFGDLCMVNGKLMYCIADTTGEYDSDDWEETTIIKELCKDGRVYPITKLTGMSLDARGDSITAGSNGPSYVPIMANLLGITSFTNSGIGGAQIGGAYNGAATTKDIVTLFAGTNDFGLTAGANTLAQFETSMRNIITNFKQNNQSARLYFITPIPRFDKSVNEYDLTLLDYVNKMCEVCADTNTPCLNLYERAGINSKNYTKYLKAAQGDLIHPNIYGATAIAIEIAKFVSEMEAIHRMISFRP